MTERSVKIEQLADAPIDLALPSSVSAKGSGGTLSPKRAGRKRVIWTALVHIIAAAIYFCVYAFPALFAWVQKAEIRSYGGSAPAGMVLLILPAVVITFIWGGGELKMQRTLTKILLSLFLIFNVAISITYLVLIDNIFTHRFF